MDFKTNEGVIEIFKSLNCIGNDNCFFVSFKDTNREGFKAGALGAVGGALGAAAAFATGVVEGIEGFDGLLINATEKGLGLVPLSVKGVQLMLNADKMEPQLDRFVFIANENIEDISVKNFNVFNKKTQKIHIKLKGGTTIHQLVHVSEKAIPYQETNFDKFMNKYKNGGAPQIESNSSTQQVNVSSNRVESTSSQTKNEKNLINNNQEKEKFANEALNVLMSNHIISDYNDIGCEYGYLYKIEGRGYEGLFKIKKQDKIYYFAVQGDNLQMINLDEQHFEAYKQTFLEIHNK